LSEPAGRRVWPRRAPVVAFALLLLIGFAALAAWYYQPRLRPTPSQLLARSAKAHEGLVELAFTLQSPWPQANPPTSGLPGARALLGPVEGQRTWRVIWHRDLGMRAQVLAPDDIAGTVTTASPASSWTYSPLLGVALSGPPHQGRPQLYIDDLMALASIGTNPRLLGQTTVGGRNATELALTIDLQPATELRLALDQATALPLAAGTYDANGRLLGRMEATDLDLAPGAAADDFELAPPAGSRVLSGAGGVRVVPTIGAAAAELQFAPQQPSYLPEGFTLRVVNLFGQDEQSALVLTYTPDGDQAGLISLTQTLVGAGHAPLAYGMPVRQGAWQGRQFEVGELRGVDWLTGNLAMTLFGTLTYAELIRVAASVR